MHGTNAPLNIAASGSVMAATRAREKLESSSLAQCVHVCTVTDTAAAEPQVRKSYGAPVPAKRPKLDVRQPFQHREPKIASAATLTLTMEQQRLQRRDKLL